MLLDGTETTGRAGVPVPVDDAPHAATPPARRAAAASRVNERRDARTLRTGRKVRSVTGASGGRGRPRAGDGPSLTADDHRPAPFPPQPTEQSHSRQLGQEPTNPRYNWRFRVIRSAHAARYQTNGTRRLWVAAYSRYASPSSASSARSSTRIRYTSAARDQGDEHDEGRPVPDQQPAGGDPDEQRGVGRVPDEPVGPGADDRLVGAGLHGEREVATQRVEAPPPQRHRRDHEHQRDHRCGGAVADRQGRKGALHEEGDEHADGRGHADQRPTAAVVVLRLRSPTRRLPHLQGHPAQRGDRDEPRQGGRERGHETTVCVRLTGSGPQRSETRPLRTISRARPWSRTRS